MTGRGKRTERACKWCGVDISSMHFNQRHCCPDHRQAYQAYRKRKSKGQKWAAMQGPPLPKICAYCGSLFSAFDPKQIYCVVKGQCGQKAYRASETGKAYFSRDDVKERRRAANRKHAATDHGRVAQAARDARLNNVDRRREYKNNRIAAASTLYLAHTISQIRGDLTNGAHEPE